MKKRFIPFWMTPRSWFLSGTALKIAEIDYYEDDEVQAKIKKAEVLSLTVFEYENTRNQILKDYKKIDEFEYQKNKLDIELKHDKTTKELHKFSELNLKKEYHKITDEHYDECVIEMMNDGLDKKLKALEFSFKYHHITEMEYEKEKHTLMKEPWFNFDADLDKETGEISLSFDYNEYFCKLLRDEGYPGITNDDVIDSYIRDWGRKVANDDYKEYEAEDGMMDLLPANETEVTAVDGSILKMHR